MENILNFTFEFRKRKEKTIIEINEEDLRSRPEKVIQMLKKEGVYLKSWFYVILFYYSIEDYTNFKKFSDELAKTDVDLNPLYRDQKQIFIYILNIFSFFYSHLSQKSKDKEKCDLFSTMSTSYVNQAEKISMYDPMTMVCKGFLLFAQGDYDNSEMYFSNISESDKNTNLNKSIVILAKLGRALNAYNKVNYSKAIEYYVSLIKDYDYINENILESLGICYYNQGEINKANQIFSQVLKINPHNYKVITYLSVLALSRLENLNSEEELNNILNSLDNIIQAYRYEEDNEFHFLLVQLANIFLMSGKIQQADEICSRLNNLLESGEIKFHKDVKLRGENSRKDFEEIKSHVYCINGKLHHFKKNNTEAFSCYRKAVSASQKNIEAQFGLGQIYLSMKDLIEAQKCFEACKAIQEKSGNEKKKTIAHVTMTNDISFEINKYLAFIYARTNKKDVDRTVELFKKALEIKSDDTDCFLELAQLLEFRKPEESLKLYEEILVLIRKDDSDITTDQPSKSNKSKINSYYTPHSLYNIIEIMPEILNNIATIKIRLHMFSDVDALLQEALSKIMQEKEKISHESHLAHHPTETAEKLVKLNSLEQSVYFNLGLYKEAKCEFDEAYRYYKQTIKTNPYFVEAYVKLGELSRIRGNKKKAMEYIQLAVDKHYQSKNKLEESSLSKNLNPNTSQLISNLFPNQKIISVMKKPIDPTLMMAQILVENGNEHEALNVLHNILKHYEEKDPYTLVFIGNIFYEMASGARGKEDFTRYLNKSLEMYYYSLEADKYNAYAAIGVANILAEYNLTAEALDTYKLIVEKMSNNHNAFVNEALINMNDSKFEKATVILNKLLKRFFKNKCPEIENILAKCYQETRDHEKAFKILKGLIFRYPDNIYYKFNYALCLKQKAEEILLKPERLVRETEDAIRSLEKAIPIFEALFSLRRETFANFKNEKEERNLRQSDFYNKCSEVLQFLHLTLINAKETLEKDKVREAEILSRIEENRIRYNQMLLNMKEVDIQQREDIKRKMEENEKVAETFKSKFEQIIQLKAEKEKEKEKSTRKGKKKEKEKEDEEFFDDNAKFKGESDNDGDDFNVKIVSDDQRRKVKKHKKNKKRTRDTNDEEELERSYIDPQDKKKLRKLRKKHRSSDDIGLFDDLVEEEEILHDDEENVYEDNSFQVKEIHSKELTDNQNDDMIKSDVNDIEMKDYTKNELEEEVDFS